MKTCFRLLCLSVLLLTFSCATPDVTTDPVSIIPQPVSLEETEGSFLIENGTVIYHEADQEEIIRVAIYLQEVLEKSCGCTIPLEPSGTSTLTDGSGLLLTTLDAGETPEAYQLSVSDQGVVIRGGDAAGIFYGVQTLRQLLLPDNYLENGLSKPLRVPAVKITDYPRFTWRGLHLDVGRHLFPVDFIKDFLDYMAVHKLNTFHWHLTEDQGWRIEIDKYPLLTEVGAYRDSTIVGHARRSDRYDGERYGGFYTKEEVREIVAYAQELFITVVPEIEMPGHATAAIASYPVLGVTGQRPDVGTTWGVYPTIYGVGDSTFIFLEDVLTEVFELFPSEYIHIGGDEAPKKLWEESPSVQQKIRELGLEDEHELQSWFITRMEKFINSKGRKIIGWDEILEGGLAPNAAVMSWRGEAGGIAAAKSGHEVVMTPTSHLYFDYYQGDPAFEPLAIGGYLSLEKVYSYDPTPDTLTETEQEYILGAQGNVWTEYIKDGDQVEYMAYPRVAALSEMVWTPENKRDWADFKSRIPRQLDRYEALGINYAKSIFLVNYQVEEVAGQYEVTLTNQLELPEMRYTIDGNEVNASSSQYSEPILLDSGQVIKAQTFVEGEPVASATSIIVGAD